MIKEFRLTERMQFWGQNRVWVKQFIEIKTYENYYLSEIDTLTFLQGKLWAFNDILISKVLKCLPC